MSAPCTSTLCKESAILFAQLYPWYYMPSSVHKLLVHGAAHIGRTTVEKLVGIIQMEIFCIIFFCHRIENLLFIGLSYWPLAHLDTQNRKPFSHRKQQLEFKDIDNLQDCDCD